MAFLSKKVEINPEKVKNSIVKNFSRLTIGMIL